MKNICYQMSRKAWLALVMVLCLSFPALAQKITVSGTVVDPTGEPLIGASVLAQGTTVGVATDFDGNYRLEVDANGSIVVSYVGYNTQTIAVNGQTTINVTLQENTVMLQEVVAIGYGVVKKSDATGSVAMVKPDDIEAGLATSAQDLLVGAAPGVVVTTDGGNPTGGAAIRIRGGASLSASNDPSDLMVDPYTPASPLSVSVSVWMPCKQYCTESYTYGLFTATESVPADGATLEGNVTVIDLDVSVSTLSELSQVRK